MHVTKSRSRCIKLSRNRNSNNAKIDLLNQIPQMEYRFIIEFIILMTSIPGE